MTEPDEVDVWAENARQCGGDLLSALVWWLFMVSLSGLWLGGAWLVGVI